jgi:DNA polymerase III sliding clamp (beta) subunit (PCNA family)
LRPVINGVFVSDQIVATDAHYMCYYPREVVNKSFIVPSSVVDLLDNTFYSVYASEEKTFYKLYDAYNQLTIIYYAIQGEYPNYKAVIPSKAAATSEFVVSGKEFMEALDLCKITMNKQSSLTKIRTDIAGKSITLTSQDIDYGKSSSVQVKAEVKIGDMEIGLSNVRLSTILTQEKCNSYHFRLIAPDRAMLINDDLLLMPMMINSDYEQ